MRSADAAASTFALSLYTTNGVFGSDAR